MVNKYMKQKQNPQNFSSAIIHSQSITNRKTNNPYLAQNTETLFIPWFPVDLNLH